MKSVPYQSKEGFTLFEFPMLGKLPFLVYGIFGRTGGISPPPYDSLNVALSTGDEKENVLHNIKAIKDYLGVDIIVTCQQVHGKKILEIDQKFLKERLSNGSWLINVGEADGMMTALPSVGLMIKVGDCQPVFLIDPVKRVISNVHCGWRGNIHNIVEEAVKKMIYFYGSSPKDLIATIGPSLGPCCFEFLTYKDFLPKEFWKYQSRPYYFNFWEITKAQLQRAGLEEQNILISGWCTKCHSEYFFSYRRLKRSGRMGAVIALKEGR